MNYLIKRAGIGIGNTTTAIMWNVALFIMAILSSVALTNINTATDEPVDKNLNKALTITLWVIFVLSILPSYFAAGNPYYNGIVLSIAIILSIVILIISTILLLGVNKYNETGKFNTAKNCYLGIIILCVIIILIYSIYVPISVYKYYKSGGFTADITNVFLAVV